MQAKNWDADSEIDGLEFEIDPKDIDDRSVPAEGNVSIILWKQLTAGYGYECIKRDRDILESWKNIPVTIGDYGMFGTTIRAEYKQYRITADKYRTGCVEITFTTTDGKTFKSLDDPVYINGY